MSSHSASPHVVDEFVKIDLHVGIESPLKTVVNSMDELVLTAGPLNLYMDAATVRTIYKELNRQYHEMAKLSNPTDPLPSLD